MARIGFLGLGEMGAPMASPIRAGHDVVVWILTAARTAPLAQQGANVAPSPATAAAGRDFVITMLATPDALEQVLFGTAGVAVALFRLDCDRHVDRGAGRGPLGRRSPAVAVSSRGRTVRGSVPQATAGKLDIFVGANIGDYERVRPILQSLGSIRRMGGLGSGAAMKLVANLTFFLGAAIVALGEALSLGESFALDRHALLDAARGVADRTDGGGQESERRVRSSSRPTSSCSLPRKT